MIQHARRVLKKAAKRAEILQTVGEPCQRFFWTHVPGVFDWKVDESTLTIDITLKCNLSCSSCDRAVGLAPSDASISVEAVERFVRESLDERRRWQRISLAGGEPTLHPELDRILRALARYREFHPKCIVRILTNGHGERVRGVLTNLPTWVTVKNSEKEPGKQRFRTFNMAPVDADALRTDDFSRGCFVIEYCGMALTRHGYYCCAQASCIDRVFGIDLGLKSLSSATAAAMREQRARLCRYCGYYKYNYREDRSGTQETSPSWRDALERYRKDPPRLTLY
jgi:hypothetical protein